MTHNLRADTITIKGHGGDEIEAYQALPTDVETSGSIVVIHHMPGYDEATKEIARKFAANGYAALMPNLYHREAPARARRRRRHRATRGRARRALVGDVGRRRVPASLSNSNRRSASIGYCSGGRQSVLAGCRLPLNAVIDCYGAFVVMDPPAAYGMKVTSIVAVAGEPLPPLLGLFGVEDQYPSPEQTATFASSTKTGKDFTFHELRGRGTRVLLGRPPELPPRGRHRGVGTKSSPSTTSTFGLSRPSCAPTKLSLSRSTEAPRAQTVGSSRRTRRSTMTIPCISWPDTH